MTNDKTKVQRTRVKPTLKRRPPPLPQTAKGHKAYRKIIALLDDGFTFDATNAWSFEK